MIVAEQFADRWVARFARWQRGPACGGLRGRSLGRRPWCGRARHALLLQVALEARLQLAECSNVRTRSLIRHAPTGDPLDHSNSTAVSAGNRSPQMPTAGNLRTHTQVARPNRSLPRIL